jgi:DNA-binding NarL/FixJ family response regulator
MRVLVADDHALFCDGIISLLKAAGFDVVGQVGDGQAAVEAASHLRPDLVLMDINMPVLNGLEALRRIKQDLPDTRVVMLTVSQEEDDLFDAIKAGAQGYLLKDMTADEFLEMVEGLQRDEVAISRKTAARLIDGLIVPTRRPDEPAMTLTEREIELLQLVADGLPNKAIAQELSISENTVKYHIKKIFQKLGVQNRTEAVANAMRSGVIGSALPHGARRADS